MELSLRLDTLGLVEMHYLRNRERYRDWPPFLLLAASRQTRILAYLSREVAEELHQQILAIEEAAGLGVDDGEEEEEEEFDGEEVNEEGKTRAAERESSPFSPALAQALDRLNDLARQRLGDASGSGSTNTPSSELSSENEAATDEEEEDALEQLQDAFVQMMDVVRELAEEFSTDALKLTSRFRCARVGIGFTRTEEEEEETEEETLRAVGSGQVELEVELALVLQLFEEGRARVDDLPAVELRLDVDDFERLHETLDIALARDERRSRRRR